MTEGIRARPIADGITCFIGDRYRSTCLPVTAMHFHGRLWRAASAGAARTAPGCSTLWGSSERRGRVIVANPP